jgi:hypothetical protein
VSQCQKCGARTGDNAQLCRKHAARLVRQLSQVPALVNDLLITATRQDRLASHSETKSSADTPLVWNESASAVAIELNATINGWALTVAQVLATAPTDDPLTPHTVPAHDTTAVARWLLRHVTTLIAHDEAGRAHTDINAAVRRARDATDRPDIRARFAVGPCPEDVDNHPCPGVVWAHIPVDESLPALMRCTEHTTCGAVWNTSQWLRAGERILRRQGQISAMRRAIGED